MHVHTGGRWVEGYLDATPGADQVRVEVVHQVALGPVDEQFFVRRPQLSMLVGYLRMLGPRRVWRKVRSRQREAARNDAWWSVGTGTDADGRTVAFVVPSGARAAERVVVPAVCCAPVDVALDGPPRHLVPAGDGPLRIDAALAEALAPLAGWHPGQAVAPFGVDGAGQAAALPAEAAAAIAALADGPVPSGAVALEARPAPSAVRERTAEPASPPAAGPSFCLFGYGQYAKTQVIPNLGAHLRLATVHELDPLQLGPVGTGDGEGDGIVWDTAGWPRPDEPIEHAAIAGYHHTHAPMAAHLLDRGVRHLVVEKPIASTRDQLDELLAAMARNPEGRVHVAFQRRHSPFNELLLADLGRGPVSMAATVYEVPLPARHWYRWPVVGNAVVSNGCHWIDHFLFLNGFAPVTGCTARRLSSQLLLAVELANGASASISLRHEGSPRRGVRDLCQFWHGDATVTIEDLRRYRSERGFGAVRHRTTHPYRALEAMYQEFGRRIAADLPGDPVAWIEASAATTLALARSIDEAAG